jgi:hypothetical protein
MKYSYFRPVVLIFNLARLQSNMEGCLSKVHAHCIHDVIAEKKKFEFNHNVQMIFGSMRFDHEIFCFHAGFWNRLALRGGGESAAPDTGERNRQKKKRKRKFKETAFSILMSDEKKRGPWKHNKEKEEKNKQVDDQPKELEEYAHGHLRPVSRINKREVINSVQGVISWDEWEQRQRDAIRDQKRNKQAAARAHRTSAPEAKEQVATGAAPPPPDPADAASAPMHGPPRQRTGQQHPAAPGPAAGGPSGGGERRADDGVTAAEAQQGRGVGAGTLRLTPAMVETMTKRQLLKAAARHAICKPPSRPLHPPSPPCAPPPSRSLALLSPLHRAALVHGHVQRPVRAGSLRRRCLAAGSEWGGRRRRRLRLRMPSSWRHPLGRLRLWTRLRGRVVGRKAVGTVAKAQRMRRAGLVGPRARSRTHGVVLRPGSTPPSLGPGPRIRAGRRAWLGVRGGPRCPRPSPIHRAGQADEPGG